MLVASFTFAMGATAGDRTRAVNVLLVTAAVLAVVFRADVSRRLFAVGGV
jgi:hypothetical protein